MLALLSSSPERFLSWSRPKRKITNSNWHNGKWSEKTSICQFRPIKGTVKKRTGDLSHPYLTIREATDLLSTTKERAENLMIVDLIRHDLHGVVGSGNVTVPKLMVVEEYATVFQLVSVVEGELVIDDSDDEDNVKDDVAVSETLSDCSDSNSSSTSQCVSSKSDAGHSTSAIEHSKTGIDVLAASLPPGSMTGAPKLRSCQLLGHLENRYRGIYSGVVGYMDVGGGGDFSVVIRSAVRWDKDTIHKDDMDGHSEDRCGAESTNDMDEDDEDEWTIGAGGAVTTLSTEDGEWEEMLTKLRSTLRLFEEKSEW
jgi:para-aminobenzoate synthetase